jgi:hypothetical protein
VCRFEERVCFQAEEAKKEIVLKRNRTRVRNVQERERESFCVHLSPKSRARERASTEAFESVCTSRKEKCESEFYSD